MRYQIRCAIRLRDFSSYNELAAWTQDYERSAAREDEDALPPRPEVSFLPEYAYRPNKNKTAKGSEKKRMEISVAAIATNEPRIDSGIQGLKKQIKSVGSW